MLRASYSGWDIPGLEEGVALRVLAHWLSPMRGARGRSRYVFSQTILIASFRTLMSRSIQAAIFNRALEDVHRYSGRWVIYPDEVSMILVRASFM